MKHEVMKVFAAYRDALEKGDFAGAFATMSDTVVWHMGGESSLSGTIIGKQALGERLGEFAKRSGGTGSKSRYFCSKFRRRCSGTTENSGKPHGKRL